jgi:hypothetical protein
MPNNLTRRSKKQIKGGVCSNASSYVTQVYGDASSQHPAGVATGNLIAMKPVVGGKLQALSPNVIGGKKNKNGGNVLSDVALPASLVYANHVLGKKNKNGGNVLSDVALPATLIYANQNFGKRHSSKKYGRVSRKNRRSRRFSRRYRK